MAISRIVLHDWQVKAWNSKKRFIYFVAGVQSGKTTFGVVWILNEAQRCGPGEYIIIAPSYKVLQQSTLVKFLEITPEGYGAYYKAESVYRTIDGRTFFLRSADKPESIEGITARAIWADEASLMKPNIWLMMQGRVSRTQGRILCTFTPISLNWIHREIEKDKERRLRGEEGDIDLIQFRSIDSPYFPKEEYERARRMLTETQFKLRYEGIFGKAEGLVYPDFGPPHIVDDFDVPAEWRRAGGIDWGYNNPFVALKGTLSPDDVLYIYAERYKEREILESHIDFLGSEIGYFGDPSGAQEIAQLRRLGVNVQEANNAVMLGIQKVTERLRPTTDDPKSIRLKIFRSCIHTIDEFALYRYPEPVGGKIVKDAPVKQDDHCFDGATEVLTSQGWKYFKDLNHTESIATLNKDWQLEWQKPVTYQVVDYDGPLCLYETFALNFAVTPDHNMAVVNQWSAKKAKDHHIELRPISELVRGKANIKKGRNIPPSQWWVPVAGQSPERKPRLGKIDGYLLGLWIAEGCKSVSRGRKYVHIDNRDEGKLLKAVASLATKSRPYQVNHCKRISIRSDELYDLLPDALCHEKYIPRWFLENANYDELYDCFCGLMDGDGCYQRRNSHYDTTSRQLADDFQELLIRLGLRGTLRRIEQAGFRRTPNGISPCRSAYRVLLTNERKSKRYNKLICSRMKFLPFRDKVYCLTVANHVICIRRMGKTMWAGQCMDALRYLVMGLSKPERRIIWLDDEPRPPTLVEQLDQFKPAEETRPEVLALNTEDFVCRFNAALLAGKIVPQIAAMLKVDIGLLQSWRTSQGSYILKVQRERQAEIVKLAEEIKAGEKQ